MASKFRLNRYNWFGQKLLAQHEYSEIVKLRQYLVSSSDSDTIISQRLTISDHLTYIHGLALMKTSTHLDEIIYALQRLNFDKNNQYFLLLCQCLLYSGNYDSVVALCKQVLNKEIDAIGIGSANDDEAIEAEQPVELLVDLGDEDRQEGKQKVQEKRKRLTLDSMVQESFEFKRIFDNINKNHLINEPRLWLTFGLCLEFQHQFKDAYSAFRVAAKLASGSANGLKLLAGNESKSNQRESHISMSNFYAPHVKFAEFCIEHKGDFRTAIQTLAQGSRLYPHNYDLNPLLALCMIAQPSSNQPNFYSAIEIISSLEAHSISNRNPSSNYNRLAIRCRRKLEDEASQLQDYSYDAGDHDSLNLSYLLVKSHISINHLTQDFGIALGERAESFRDIITKRVDKLLETLRNSDPTCRISASFWNNLGLCYLVNRRFIACFSCLSKAHQINPLDWQIQYNLAIACAHVDLFNRALVCLQAASRLYIAQSSGRLPSGEESRRCNPLITTMLAICYERIGELDESRRLHIESIRSSKGNYSQIPIFSLINYLTFLHNHSHYTDAQSTKLKLHLLDQLEHRWLKRNHNDPQFNADLLLQAQEISDFIGSTKGKPNEKNYAWTKALHESLRDLH